MCQKTIRYVARETFRFESHLYHLLLMTLGMTLRSIYDIYICVCVCVCIKIHTYVHYIYIYIYIKLKVSCSVVSDSLRPHGLQPARLLCLWNFPGKNTGVGCHFLLQGIFLTQGLSPAVSDSLPLNHRIK